MLGVAGLFAASLASKPMYVTFPFLLLLLDAWPLDRVKWGALRAREFAASGLPRLVAEKWPLFVLTALSCAITISVQTAAIVTMEQFPLLQRIASVPYAYVTYIGMTLWPVGLIPMQLHPGREISVAFGFAMGAVLIAATGAVLARASRAPAVAVGWLWFLGMLLPVIGILQVGSTLVADRYTYLSSVGLFIAATWTFADALARTSAPRWVGPVAGVAVLGLCAVLTRGQVPYWTDTVSLFARTVEVEPANHVAHSHLGNGYELRGEDELALVHHTRAAQLRSYHHMSLFALGERLVREGRFDLATRAFEAELAAKPDAAPARLQLAALRQRQGDGNGARAQLEFARAILPDSAEVLGKMAFLEGSLGDFAAAEQKLREALAVDPGYAEGYGALALLLARRGDFDEARELAARSAELEPTSAQAAELVKHLNQLEAAARAPAGGGS
jgi:Flp pilus assembly protein TadD